MLIASAGHPALIQQKLFDLEVVSRNQNKHSHSVVAALISVCAYNCKSWSHLVHSDVELCRDLSSLLRLLIREPGSTDQHLFWVLIPNGKIKSSSQDWLMKANINIITKMRERICVCYLVKSSGYFFFFFNQRKSKNEMDRARSTLRMMSQKTWKNCKIECSNIKLFTHFIRFL